MEQIGLFFIPEEAAYAKIKPALLSVLDEYGLDESHLTFGKKKTYFSAWFNGANVFLRIHEGQKPYIEIPEPQRNNFKKIYLESVSEILSHECEVKDALRGVIENVAKEFDCCHRYEACSNAKKCVHPDKLIALTCGYRKVLQSGHIFYGKNRNID